MKRKDAFIPKAKTGPIIVVATVITQGKQPLIPRSGPFFMEVKVAIHRIIAVLDFPTKIPDFIVYAKAIQGSMSTSSYFTSLATKIAALLTAINDLDAAEAGFKSHPPTFTSEDRDGKLAIAQNQIRLLRNDVQAIADADIANAEIIIVAASMKVKKIGTRGKGEFKAEFGGNSGVVKLTAPGIPHNQGSHAWGWSLDGTNWTNLPGTTDAHTFVNGLTVGSLVDFRHRTITSGGESEWEEIDNYVVQ